MSHNTQEVNIKIPVPYGNLLARVWGESGDDKVNILAVHGWQDNAGTFERLIPMLDNRDKLYIVAVDLSGHGLSSHIPRGFCYTDLHYIIEIKRVIDYLKWDQVNIIAHSMGANISLQFAAMYPDLVTKLIIFDTVKPPLCPAQDIALRYSEDMINFLRLEERDSKVKPKEHVFKYNMAIQVLIAAHSPIGCLNNDSAACLLKRATKIVKNIESGINGYSFTRDNRLNAIVYYRNDLDSLKALLSRINCQLLIINAKNGLWRDREYQKDFLELYQMKCKKFVYVEVDGDHYVHLTRPHNVASHINQFFSQDINQSNDN